jgi:hypothetical protein
MSEKLQQNLESKKRQSRQLLNARSYFSTVTTGITEGAQIFIPVSINSPHLAEPLHSKSLSSDSASRSSGFTPPYSVGDNRYGKYVNRDMIPVASMNVNEDWVDISWVISPQNVQPHSTGNSGGGGSGSNCSGDGSGNVSNGNNTDSSSNADNSSGNSTSNSNTDNNTNTDNCSSNTSNNNIDSSTDNCNNNNNSNSNNSNGNSDDDSDDDDDDESDDGSVDDFDNDNNGSGNGDGNGRINVMRNSDTVVQNNIISPLPLSHMEGEDLSIINLEENSGINQK